MKIGIDAHSLGGLRTGARGRYLLNLVKEWSKIDTGDDQFILYFQEKIPEWKFLDNPKFIKKILRGVFGIKSFTIYYNFLLPWAAQKDKVDICFFPFYMLPFTYRAKNAVVTIHDVYFEVNPKEFHFFRHWLPLHLLTKNAAKNAKFIVTPSEFSKNEIKKYYKTDPSHIKVVYLAPDSIFSAQKPQEGVNTTKEKYGLKNSYFLSVGTIFNRRFVDRSIKVFAKLAKHYESWQFFISGRNLTCPYIDLDSMIKDINDSVGRKAIIRVDHIDDEDLINLYAGASFTIYLSSYEGFGLPPLESMISGVPVITTNFTALKESVNGAGIIIKNPEDINEISRAIERLMTNQEFREEMAGVGRKWIEQFGWEKTAKKTLEVLKSCKAI